MLNKQKSYINEDVDLLLILAKTYKTGFNANVDSMFLVISNVTSGSAFSI
ncbi:hypothetical protein EHE19_012065 [Ruminiclostridium herbifermentans]|uniref:Uncharacterized protein n=1 Tax=Ruminiclostridium herbifermentans TaxID=2488810 RepID=A0A7H1VJU5_9FIRM|nr:hypothetical protein [Ruminiclostridium herbifermentans]QNU65657.1 hypothetical protein EHE19_012065 [Ruminiclostridium herbifermentans]